MPKRLTTLKEKVKKAIKEKIFEEDIDKWLKEHKPNI